MSTEPASSLPPDLTPAPVAIPPLQPGDRMNRIEFERRYRAMGTDADAELVEGVVYMPSPVSARDHGEPHFDFVTWLGLYRAFTPGVRGGDNSSLRLDIVNMPQPDAYLRIEPEFGGGSRLVDGIVVGPPELVAEIAASSVSYDMHDKLKAYQRNLVQEYLVWRVLDRAIDWFELVDGVFRPIAADEGILRSRVFPGLWLDTEAALNGDAARVVQVLQSAVNSNEHRKFVERLKSSRGRSA